MQAHSGTTRSLASRSLWFVLGLACVVLGAVGVIVPGLPTTVFFIAAAASFARSSPRLEAWVLGLPGVGRAVQDYREGRGMPARAKVTAIVMVVAMVTLSVVLLDSWLVRVPVAIAGVVGLLVIARVPTRR